MQAECLLCDTVMPAKHISVITDKIYFESHTFLSPEEYSWFCYGLRLCEPYLNKITDKKIWVRLHRICFSDCDIQNEAFADAVIQRISKTLNTVLPKVSVSFNDALGYNGLYCFDFKNFDKTN